MPRKRATTCRRSSSRSPANAPDSRKNAKRRRNACVGQSRSSEGRLAELNGGTDSVRSGLLEPGRHAGRPSAAKDADSGEVEICDHEVMIRCQRWNHGLAHQAQRVVVENVIEHVRLASPGDGLNLRGAKADRAKLGDQIHMI